MRTNPQDAPLREDVINAIPSCALDDAGRLEQRAQYARLAATVSGVDRDSAAVAVQFDDHLDRDLLERALAVERRCCPFFAFDFDRQMRRLEIAVSTANLQPALDAIAAAFAESTG
jgi:hypothetical protein